MRKATLTGYHHRHQSCLFAGRRTVGEGRLAVCRDDGPKACGQTGLAPTHEFSTDGVTPGRLAGRAARLAKTASLACATRHNLRAFQGS